MNIYVLLGGIGLAVAIFLGGFKCGEAVEGVEAAQARAGELDKIITKDRVVIQQVPKIVTKVVTQTVTVEKEVQGVILKVDRAIKPDCVMPDGYAGLLINAAQGGESTGRVDESTGEYGCREVLTATLKDLKAGWINTARLEGLQAWVNVVK